MKDERQVAFELLVREMEQLADLIRESQQNQDEFMHEAYRIIQEQGQDVELMRNQQSLGQYILQQMQSAIQADGKLPSTIEIALPPELQDHFQIDPGTMQPGSMIPGSMQPGMMPSGSMQPGMMPSGSMQPGMMPSGSMQPGMMPSGSMQPGMMPSGSMQPGMMPSGSMQPGMMPSGSMQPGMMPSGSMQPGMMPSGSMQPGMMPSGSMQPGMMPSGSMPADDTVVKTPPWQGKPGIGTQPPQPTELVPPMRPEGTAVAAVTDDVVAEESEIRPQKTAQVQMRFLHAAPSLSDVDVHVDGRRVATDVGYEGVSPYLPFRAGAHRVQLFRTGQTSGPIADQEIKLLPNRHYTVVVTGQLEDVKPLVVEDSRRGGKPGFARLKIVHLAPNAPSVDVTLPSGKILIGDLQFRKISPYLQVTPGVRDLVLRRAGTKEELLKIPQITFDKNITYTLYVLGQVSPQRPMETLLLPEA